MGFSEDVSNNDSKLSQENASSELRKQNIEENIPHSEACDCDTCILNEVSKNKIAYCREGSLKIKAQTKATAWVEDDRSFKNLRDYLASHSKAEHKITKIVYASGEEVFQTITLKDGRKV
jgi:hypothetical protein